MNDYMELNQLNEEDRDREKLGYEKSLFLTMKKITKNHKKDLDKKIAEAK